MRDRIATQTVYDRRLMASKQLPYWKPPVRDSVSHRANFFSFPWIFCQRPLARASFYTAATQGWPTVIPVDPQATVNRVSVLAAKNVQPANVDSVLVQMLRDDDERALEELLRKEGDDILRLTQRLTGWHADSHDLCQDVFIAAWKHGAKIESDEALARWLKRVAVNRCRSWHRRQFIKDRLFRWLRSDRNESYRGDAEQFLNREWVRHGLARLRPRDREILVLRYMEHLEINEIASVLHISRAAVDARLGRARSRLSQLLAQGEQP